MVRRYKESIDDYIDTSGTDRDACEHNGIINNDYHYDAGALVAVFSQNGPCLVWIRVILGTESCKNRLAIS